MPSNPQANIVDLRSDTVTRPTQEMVEAMLAAPVGDDVLGDDPTVTELEQLAARMLGKEAAVFTPSGTMANQIAIATHTSPGDVVIMEEDAHVFFYEVGAPAILANVLTRTLPSTMGVMDPDRVEQAVMKRNLHTPGTSLICVENTHNRAGGTTIPLSAQLAYREICDRHGLALHLDGARAFNASVALGVSIAELVRAYDSVSICLSKGLRSPVGSVLVGSSEFIEQARYWRKRLGGGMRQSGILAACGIVSLTKMVDRLAEDHERALEFGKAAQQIPGITLDLSTVQTNMVIVGTKWPHDLLLQAMRQDDVWALSPGPNRIRFVFHADVDDEKAGRAIESLRQRANELERSDVP